MSKNVLVSLLAGFALAISTLSMAGDAPAVGGAAPDFRMQDQNGEWHTLADYRGGWLAVYFYPKAVSYTHLTLPTMRLRCRSRWSPYH